MQQGCQGAHLERPPRFVSWGVVVWEPGPSRAPPQHHRGGAQHPRGPTHSSQPHPQQPAAGFLLSVRRLLTLLHGGRLAAAACATHTAMKKLRIVRLGFGTARQKRALNVGRIQNPYHPFGIVPLFYFVPRGFGFVHHSIAIFYHEVPNPNLTIRNFFIAVTHPPRPAQREGGEVGLETAERSHPPCLSSLASAQGVHGGRGEIGCGAASTSFGIALRFQEGP
jgi:hypothetical protein